MLVPISHIPCLCFFYITYIVLKWQRWHSLRGLRGSCALLPRRLLYFSAPLEVVFSAILGRYRYYIRCKGPLLGIYSHIVRSTLEKNGPKFFSHNALFSVERS
jgi:hypothetical protein